MPPKTGPERIAFNGIQAFTGAGEAAFASHDSLARVGELI